MKKINKKIFVADDGKEFMTQIECENYEAKLKEEEKNTSYWQIICNPDLTEGRGHYGLIFARIKVDGYTNPKLMLSDYCYRTIGRPVAFVQGCAPIANWHISEIDKFQYFSGGKTKVGDYSYPSKSLDLIQGTQTEGLIEKK